MKYTFKTLALTTVGLLSACSVGPDYVRPDIAVPASFKEAPQGWKVAQPGQVSSADWWEVFNDPILSNLESQVAINNQNIKFAEAQYRQARALVQENRADYFPVVAANAGATYSGKGRSGSTTGGAGGNNSNSRSYQVNLTAGWEADVWGRVRREVESVRASAKASQDDLAAARLSAQSELAQDYLQLRVTDAQAQAYADTVTAYRKALLVTQNQYNAGIAGKSDVLQAQVQLDAAISQSTALGVQRAQLEHAISVLLGKAPADFALAALPDASVPNVPEIPAAVPTSLLERRPDIAAAERRAAAANAQIGVAEAAYFPDLTIDATAGLASSSIQHLLELPARAWSVGPALAETLFDGGLRRAQKKEAQAVYDQTVATYRQTVLTGLQETEDDLAALRILQEQSGYQADTVNASTELQTVANNQYKAGTISYLNVITAQTSLLNSRITALNIQQQRLLAAVGLIESLGGGWKTAENH